MHVNTNTRSICSKSTVVKNEGLRFEIREQFKVSFSCIFRV